MVFPPASLLNTMCYFHVCFYKVAPQTGGSRTNITTKPDRWSSGRVKQNLDILRFLHQQRSPTPSAHVPDVISTGLSLFYRRHISNSGRMLLVVRSTSVLSACQLEPILVSCRFAVCSIYFVYLLLFASRVLITVLSAPRWYKY